MTNLAAWALMVVFGLAACAAAAEPGAAQASAAPGPRPTIQDGDWRGFLRTAGGPLPFILRIQHPITDDRPAGIAAFLVNGPEVQEIPLIRWDGDDLVFRLDYYDAEIRARIAANGATMEGEFSRRRGKDAVVRMVFGAARPDAGPTRTKSISFPEQRLRSRYAVRFEGEADPAVLVLGPAKEGSTTRFPLAATFLTTTGDYRYLSGDIRDGTLTLSTFNGVHAFLFTAKVGADATLSGDFFSGPASRTAWTATPDPGASLPDAFGMAEVGDDSRIGDLSYTSADGAAVTLGDKSVGGGARARILYVFGTWCPNCKDATAALNEMVGEWGPRGLAVTGLAFEVTGDRERDLRQVNIYRERSRAAFPIVLAGTTDKQQRAAAFPVLKEIKAFPTLVFVDSRSRVRAVYTGFSGPATGEAYTKMREQFDSLVKSMLKDGADRDP